MAFTARLLAVSALVAIVAMSRVGTAQPSGSAAAACGAGQQVCATGCCPGSMAACSTFANNQPPKGTWCYTTAGGVYDGSGTCDVSSKPVPALNFCCPTTAPSATANGCWGPIPAGSPAASCGSGKQVCPTGCCSGTMQPCANFTNQVPPAGTFCYDTLGNVASAYNATGACTTTAAPVPVSATFCCPTSTPIYGGGTTCKSGAGMAQVTVWVSALAAVLAMLASMAL